MDTRNTALPDLDGGAYVEVEVAGDDVEVVLVVVLVVFDAGGGVPGV